MVFILLVAYAVCLLDRQVLNILAVGVRAGLHISEFQFALLAGPAFAIFYTLCGLPLGWLADRGNRVRLIVAGMLIWSVATAACGLATGFASLFFWRVVVGIGEASLVPAGMSLISDLFGPVDRPRALALYAMGSSVGVGLAFVGVAAIVPQADHVLPLLGRLAPWRIVMIEVALPGIILAAIILAMMREPPRNGQAAGGDRPSPLQGIRFIWARRGMYGWFIGATSTHSLITYGIGAFLAPYFIRTYGWSVPKVGLVYGLTILSCALPGAVAGGWLASRMRRNGRPEATIRAMWLAASLAAIPTACIWIVGSPTLAIILLGINNFCLGANFLISNAAIADVTPNRYRGLTVSTVLSILTILGLGLGPPSVAALTQFVFGDDRAVGLSLAIFCGVLGPVEVFMLWKAQAPFRRGAEAARAWETGIEQPPAYAPARQANH
jgi:MFS family permease